MRAWARVKQPHFTFHVPSACNYVQIKPNLAEGLINRQHKMFVMINNQTLQAMPMVPGHSIDPLRPLFETRLEPGTSRIDIQIRATLPRDAPEGLTARTTKTNTGSYAHTSGESDNNNGVKSNGSDVATLGGLLFSSDITEFCFRVFHSVAWGWSIRACSAKVPIERLHTRDVKIQ